MGYSSEPGDFRNGESGGRIATLAANIFSTILYFSLFHRGNNRLYQTRQTFRLDWLMKRLLLAPWESSFADYRLLYRVYLSDWSVGSY